MKALVVGQPEPAGALVAALGEGGIEAEAYQAPDLASAFTDLEGRLAGVELAVAIGSGDAPTALAVTAAKLGVPLAAWAGNDPPGGELDEAERRIVTTLADFDAGAGSASEAAERIVSWALLDLTK